MLLSRFHSRTKEDNESLGDEIFRNREAPAFFFRWRFEISNVEITDDEPEEDMVVCCECRGTTVATEPFSLSKSRAGQLQSVLGFDTILYSKSTLLDGDVETFFASTRGEGTSKDSLSCFFASFVVRLAVRTKTSTGELVDCMALDLCTLAAQSESGKDHKLELQLGGEICTRIVCNRLGRVDAQNHAVKDESQPRVSTPQVDRIDSAASAESPSDERMAGYFNTFRSLSLELYDSEGGTQERSDWGDKASLSSPERLSMVSTCSEQDRSPLAKEANFDGTDSFSQDFGLEIEEASSSPDLPHGSLDPRDDSHKTTAASESGSDEGDGSVPNRIVVTTHPLTPLVTARFSHQEYRLRADTPASERPVTTHVQTPKPLGTSHSSACATGCVLLADEGKLGPLRAACRIGKRAHRLVRSSLSILQSCGAYKAQNQLKMKTLTKISMPEGMAARYQSARSTSCDQRGGIWTVPERAGCRQQQGKCLPCNYRCAGMLRGNHLLLLR